MEPEGETRVAIVPGSMKKLMKAGFEIIVENGAGNNATGDTVSFSDLNGDLNGGNYKLTIISMNATW